MGSSNAVDEMFWASSIIQQRNGINVGFIESGIDLNNQNNPFVQIGAVRFVNEEPIYSVLSASVSADGTRYSHAPTPPNNATGNVIATVDWVQQNSLPTGSCIVWSSPTPPSGFLICDGSAISRTTYAKLFAITGTAFGAGDGSTTFNLPNCTDFAPWQSAVAKVGSYGLGNAPNITGSFGIVGNTNGSVPVGSGAFAAGSISGGAYGGGGGRSTEQTTFFFDASRSSIVYTTIDRIVPAWVSMKWCIKY